MTFDITALVKEKGLTDQEIKSEELEHKS